MINGTTLSGSEHTTNNFRMELLAVVSAMEHMEPGSQAVIYTDDLFIVKRGNRIVAAKDSRMPKSEQDLWERFTKAAQGKLIGLKHLEAGTKKDCQEHNAAHQAAREAAFKIMSFEERVASTREAGAVERGDT